MEPQVLIIEDDPVVSRMLDFLLTDNGYRATVIADPRAVGAFLRESPVDLILLDVMLPYIDGFTLCSMIRNEHGDTPIIIVSARDSYHDKVEGFSVGADDYVSKPFELNEFLARIAAVLRRRRRADRDSARMRVAVGEANLDIGQLQFTAQDRPSMRLTPTEMSILECLMRNANLVVSREALIEGSSGYLADCSSNRMDVYVRRLRKKIERDPDAPEFVHTVRGVGYIFRDRGAEATPRVAD